MKKRGNENEKLRQCVLSILKRWHVSLCTRWREGKQYSSMNSYLMSLSDGTPLMICFSRPVKVIREPLEREFIQYND